ncbi:uncharacterized protein [Venturia canescens]|uniref:uncharacterized protein n=1 Tax=Venturia canescens TaxID=32260 RepID=UPI001C9C13FE|nr:uncharacterized protein LOC122412744 [Venturia canescens]XP_043278477.1 uncharacterized protein LOC122412744 [Venturia canescens]
MRLAAFLLIIIGTGTVEIRETSSKPAGSSEETASSEERFGVVKREDSTRVYLEQCSIVKFQNARRGSVSVLAFLDASWPYSHRQALMLEMLRSRLRKSGLTDILFFVVNVSPYFPRKIDTAKDDIEREVWLEVSPDEIEGFSRINKTFDSLASSIDSGIELIQDDEELGIWKDLGGSRDQVLVIDRCGKLTYQVIVPWSILHFPYVKAAILSTYNEHPCGLCEKMENLEEPSSTVGSVTTIVDGAERGEPPIENFVSSSENSQTEAATSASIFFPSTVATTVPDSRLPNLIDETRDRDGAELVREKTEETTTEIKVSTVQGAREVSTIFPQVEASGSGESATGIVAQAPDYDPAVFHQEEKNPDSETPEFAEGSTQDVPEFVSTEAASTTLRDSFDFGSESPDYATTDAYSIDDSANTTPETISEDGGFTTDSRLRSAEDSSGFDPGAVELSTARNHQAMGDVWESTTPETLSLVEASTETISKKNEESEDATWHVPIRIIMHAPHFHVDVDSTRMHEYLVMKTGSTETHGHLASHDATRLYNGPQDHREPRIPDSAAAEIERKKWPMRNLIFTRNESTGLFGEVADYWRDPSSLDSYDESEETERPDQERIYEEGLTNGKLWDQSSTDKNENSKALAESLTAGAVSETVTEVQPIAKTEEFDSEEEETQNRLIAHYSKLLPWIYYVLD